MTVYAMSSHAMVSVGPEHGGCGHQHLRPVDETGYPVQPWAIDCPACEGYLRTDPLFSVTVEDIVATHDEAKAAERWEKQGARDQQALLTAAVSQLAGFGPAQMPESLQRMLGQLKPHVPVAGVMVCPAGHSQPAGQRFCGQCGTAMTSPVPAAAIGAAS